MGHLTSMPNRIVFCCVVAVFAWNCTTLHILVNEVKCTTYRWRLADIYLCVCRRVFHRIQSSHCQQAERCRSSSRVHRCLKSQTNNDPRCHSDPHCFRWSTRTYGLYQWFDVSTALHWTLTSCTTAPVYHPSRPSCYNHQPLLHTYKQCISTIFSSFLYFEACAMILTITNKDKWPLNGLLSFISIQGKNEAVKIIRNLVLHPRACSTQLHLAPMALDHTSSHSIWCLILVLAVLNPLRLLATSSEFPAEACHSFAAAYRQCAERDPTGSSGAHKPHENPLWPSGEYKNATGQIWSRCAQNCGHV